MYESVRSGIMRRGRLRLYWEVSGDPITDDYAPDEVSARDMWDLWRERNPGDTLPIWWFVRGPGVIEAAPVGGQQGELWAGRDFLLYFTWPEHEDGSLIRWTDLPVVDKVLSADQSYVKGWFIQTLTGWKPSPLQSVMDVATIERLALRDDY